MLAISGVLILRDTTATILPRRNPAAYIHVQVTIALKDCIGYTKTVPSALTDITQWKACLGESVATFSSFPLVAGLRPVTGRFWRAKSSHQVRRSQLETPQWFGWRDCQSKILPGLTSPQSPRTA